MDFFLAFVALLRGASRERQDSTYRISGAHELGNIDGDFPLGEGAVIRHVDYIDIESGGVCWGEWEEKVVGAD